MEDIMALHDYATRRYGGSYGVGRMEGLESALSAPPQTMFGEELYRDVYAKASIPVFLLTKNHPFVDGNKRSGLYATLRFLEVNGLGAEVPNQDELYQFTIDIATSNLDKEGIREWLRANTVALS